MVAYGSCRVAGVPAHACFKDCLVFLVRALGDRPRGDEHVDVGSGGVTEAADQVRQPGTSGALVQPQVERVVQLQPFPGVFCPAHPLDQRPEFAGHVGLKLRNRMRDRERLERVGVRNSVSIMRRPRGTRV